VIEKNTLGGGFFAQYGIRVQNGAKNITIQGNDISGFQVAGIYVSDTTVIPEHVIIRDNMVYRNGNGGVNNGNILIDSAKDTLVEYNYIGSSDEDQALNGVRVGTSSVATTVANNVVYEVKASGIAYNLATGNNITGIWEFRGNRYLGSQTFIAGVAMVPYRRDYSTAVGGQILTHAQSPRGVLSGDITPTYGTWGAGSTVINNDSVTGQTYLTKCTVSGSPGTWKPVSTVG
jgi:hypothetical protein